MIDCVKVDKLERTQVRLLLEHLSSEYSDKSDKQLEAMRSQHAAKGCLQSGSTVRESLRIIEAVANDYVKAITAAVSDVSQDTEAFGMIATDVTLLLRTMQVSLDRSVRLASGTRGATNDDSSVSREANRLFMNLHQRVLRLLEIHRFTFTRPSSSVSASVRAEVPAPDHGHPKKNKGGKPLAGHWDEMWSTVAVQLYVGDLQPTSQADIEREMLNWFAQRGLEIGETSVRGRARQLWQRLEAAK